MQSRLLVSAILLVFGTGLFFFIQANPVAAQSKQSPTPSASTKKATPSPLVSPVRQIKVIGKKQRLYQPKWDKQASVTPILISSLPEANLSQIRDKDRCSAAKIINDGADREIGVLTSYAKLNQLHQPEPEQLEGLKDVELNEGYLISNVLRTTESDAKRNTPDPRSSQNTKKANSTRWNYLSFNIRPADAIASNYKFYYRATNNANEIVGNFNDAWVELKDPEITYDGCDSRYNLVRFKINKIAEFFQYKIHITADDHYVKDLYIDAEPVNISYAPGPSPSPTPSGSPSPSPEGKIFIETKRLISKPKPSASASAGPVLPNITPSSTKASPSPKSNKPNPSCFDEKKTEPAANVPVSIRQTEGGEIKIEDQTTDADGLWRSYLGADKFPVGKYTIEFGEYIQEDYKIVDICIVNGDQNAKGKIERSTKDKSPNVKIKKDEQTRIILLYGPRSKPYVNVSKFAVGSNNKILKVVYPGVSFRYLIRYENTGEADAKDLVIQDLIPEQYHVQGVENQTIEDSKSFDMEIDATGRTLVKRTIGTLGKSEKGSFVIPVTLKPNAFGSPDDVAAQFAPTPSEVAPAAATSPAASVDPDSSPQLQ